MQFLIKTLVSAVIIASASELAKRSTLFAAILISLPVTSILAMIWLYRDTGDAAKVSDLSKGILWAVLPSLLFFALLPYFLSRGFKFPASLLMACAIMTGGYLAFTFILSRFGFPA